MTTDYKKIIQKQVYSSESVSTNLRRGLSNIDSENFSELISNQVIVLLHKYFQLPLVVIIVDESLIISVSKLKGRVKKEYENN